ncbi:hypothetical protein [Streptomyces violaceus]|uniref:hypothetical protein n=1 Tax=Streptomyces violaceus TaxID=1936 RepID=UPI00187505EE|nr:hypothetical protein GCM10010270_58540 [Streptomyces janthinus]
MHAAVPARVLIGMLEPGLGEVERLARAEELAGRLVRRPAKRRPSPTERTVNRALSAARAPVEKATARPRRPAGLGAGRGSG